MNHRLCRAYVTSLGGVVKAMPMDGWCLFRCLETVPGMDRRQVLQQARQQILEQPGHLAEDAEDAKALAQVGKLGGATAAQHGTPMAQPVDGRRAAGREPGPQQAPAHRGGAPGRAACLMRGREGDHGPARLPAALVRGAGGGPLRPVDRMPPRTPAHPSMSLPASAQGSPCGVAQGPSAGSFFRVEKLHFEECE